jgi:hypothetical protein
MNNLTGAAKFRALQRRLVPREAYLEKREYMAATKKLRDALIAAEKVDSMYKQAVHECGHAVVALHHGLAVDCIVLAKKTALGRQSFCSFASNMDGGLLAVRQDWYLQALVAGAVSGYMRCHDIAHESSDEIIFRDGTDAHQIALVLDSSESTKIWDTALSQSVIGLTVTGLPTEHVKVLIEAVQNAQTILRTHDLKFKALAQALCDTWDAQDENREERARLDREMISSVWEKTKTEERENV